MQFDEHGKLKPYQTAKERLRQVEAGLAAIRLCTTVMEAHAIAKSLYRADGRWRRAIKPSQQRILFCEATLWRIRNMDSLDSIIDLAKANHATRRVNNQWSTPNPWSFSELQKAEATLGDWKP